MSSDEIKALIGRIGRKQIKIVESIERSWENTQKRDQDKLTFIYQHIRLSWNPIGNEFSSLITI